MKNKTLTKTLWIAVIVLFMTSLFYSEAFAWGSNFHGGDRGNRGSRGNWGWGRSYHSSHSSHDRWYDSGFFGFSIALPSKAGSIALKVPIESKTVITKGEQITINVPNSNGSYTPVTLVKYGNGYIGPQGEYYPGNPTVEQLKALYGK